MKAKKSSYEKVKEENTRLKQDIYNLVVYKDTVVGMQTFGRYRMQFNISAAIMAGSNTNQ